MGKPLKPQQRYEIRKKNEQKILKLCPNADQGSGIYCIYRIDENGFKHAYVGQTRAKGGLLERLAQHLEGYKQHIDKSIIKYGLYDELKNPYGYRIKILCLCNTQEELNAKEQYYIKEFANSGWQMKNTTIGSQGKGKVGLNDNKPPKNYREGVAYGELKTIRKVREYFDKYLDYSVKQPSNKVKERKCQEFTELLKGEENDEGTTDRD